MNENVKEFLNDLSELTKKYRIVIGGCGCCGSPYLDKLDDSEGESDEIGEGLSWDYKNCIYKVYKE